MKISYTWKRSETSAREDNAYIYQEIKVTDPDSSQPPVTNIYNVSGGQFIQAGAFFDRQVNISREPSAITGQLESLTSPSPQDQVLCPYCRIPIQGDEETCPVCRQKLTVCRVCGAPVTVRDKSCVSCGAEIGV